jgi:hypothetical protein
MILLISTSDLFRVTTSSAADVDVHADWIDLNAGVTTPGRTNTAISTATTTTVVGSPSASTSRTIKTVTIRNKHATTSNEVTVLHSDGTTVVEMVKFMLPAGFTAIYDEGSNWSLQDVNGRELSNTTQNGNAAAVNALNLVVLSSDVVNNNAVANTIADITGLSFSITAGETYWFSADIDITSAASTTGGRLSVSGPGAPTRLAYRVAWPTTAVADTLGNGLSAYDLPASSSGTTSQPTGNVATITGYITPSTSGTLQLRFASEVASSAITAKAGSLLQWVRVI